MRSTLPLLALLSVGCVRSLEGPFLGTCAEPPDGVYTYGQVDIGTCLAGPVDVQFHEDDGDTWLVVSNADPSLNFTSGSILLIDWASIDLDTPVNLMGDLDAHALPTDRFNGEFGLNPERDLLLVTNRFSEDAVSRTSDDRGFVIDISDPRAPTLRGPVPVLGMQDDPYLVAVDEDEDIAYVGNLTDHSISLFDLGADIVSQIDIAPRTVIDVPQFVDVDDSGSLGTIDSITIVDQEIVDPDLWTLTFVEKLVRLWVPTPNEEGALGLVRWTSGAEEFVPSGLGLEIDPLDDPLLSEIEDPFVTVDGSGLLRLFYAQEGVIRTLTSVGPAGDWGTDDVLQFSGGGAWDEVVGGPSATGLSATLGALYYDGRTAPGATASIGLATTEDGITYVSRGDPVITDPAGQISFEQPFVRADAVTSSFRMWMSIWDGATWTIGLSESADGVLWSDPAEVLALDGLHAAAPAVSYVNGRYLLYFTVGDGETWTHATAWSYDGITWSDVTLLFDSEVPFDVREPPRPALQLDPTDAWRMEGRDEGLVPTLIPAGVRFVVSSQGLSLVLADGHEVGNGLLPDNRSAEGLQPGSVAEVGGLPTMYVTGTGSDQRQRIGIVREVGDSFAVLETNVIPAGTGGNVAGVSDPVVVEQDGTYVMFYAAIDAEGVTRIRRATSTDGRAFEPVQGVALETADEWDDLAMLPHSVEALDNGQVRLWYSGFDGSRWRIGAAVADDLQGAFVEDPGAFDPWQLAPGTPGSFDDSGVKDPMVFEADGVTQMYYAGFDGLTWHLGHAELVGGEWVRRLDPVTGQSVPSMSGLSGSFSAAGVDKPVLQLDDGEAVLWYAGTDGIEPRLGRALPAGPVVFPAQRFPTPGDRFTFEITPGGPGESNIELEQAVSEFATTGIGMSALTLDEDRGFLYVTSKLANFVYVIDVRDDSSGVFDDANYLDIEALISVQSDMTPIGFRGAAVDQVRDRLYLTSRDPEGVVVIDLDDLVDDDRKDVVYDAAENVLPLLDATEDAGETTLADIGGNGMAISPDASTLFVTHFRNNALWAYDLSLGAHGEPVGYLPHIGENPHMVRLSPDGRFAVVANMLGDVEDDAVSSTLAVVDVDPLSETYLEIVTWLVNR